MKRISAVKKAKQLAKYLRKEYPDYHYLKQLFQHLRMELDIEIPKGNKKLPYVPTEDEIRKYYESVWQSNNFKDMMIIKILLYTGVRVSELVNIKIQDLDLNACQIRIEKGKGEKDRIVPFPSSFKELIALYIQKYSNNKSKYLFESSWKKKYSDRGIRKILQKYVEKAGISHSISPHKMRHFLFTWLKKKGVDDALIQPYSGHSSRKSLEIYSKLSIIDAQKKYEHVISEFPIWGITGILSKNALNVLSVLVGHGKTAPKDGENQKKIQKSLI